MNDTTANLADSDAQSLRAALMAERDAAEAQIAQLSRSFDEIVEAVELTNNDDEHDPEGTTIAFERAQVAALLQQARADLDSILASLQRLDDGTYGLCDDCGNAIGLERLTVIPSAAKCIGCA